MDINTQVNTYFAATGDATEKGEAVPNTTSGNNITLLIDGRAYFQKIHQLLNSMGTGPKVSQQFFYVTGWYFHLTPGTGSATQTDTPAPTSPTTRTTDSDPAFQFDDTSPPVLMAQLLAEKAAAGVDVRVMGWVNPALLIDSVAKEIEGYWRVTLGTLLSIVDLRGRTVGTPPSSSQPLAQRVCALTIGHLLGAMHLKMVVAHDGNKAWAFVGGIDFAPSRIADPSHNANGTWHDAQVSVEGPAVQAAYNLYRNLWNEQVARQPTQQLLVNGNIINSVVSGTTSIPSRTLASTGSGKHRVQVTRTLPQFRLDSVKKAFNLSFGVQPLSFAPNGVFEVRVAWRKAIANATRYIYIEDQSFWSQEVMGWLNERLRKSDTVKVILLSGGLVDPADRVNDGPLVEAINNHLLGVGKTTELNPSQRERVGFFIRKQVFVHSKLTIVDDHWLLVGSANCMRRSLFTDGEISFATLDEQDQLAKNARVALWGEHFGKSGADRALLVDIDHALAVWNPKWGSSPPYPLPTNRIDARPLPLPPPKVPFDTDAYNKADFDSRNDVVVPQPQQQPQQQPQPQQQQQPQQQSQPQPQSP